MAEFLVGVVTGLSLAGLLWILLPPSRRARAERPLDRDTETRLLLGLDPDPSPQPGPEVEHPRTYDASELQALRRIGPPKRNRR